MLKSKAPERLYSQEGLQVYAQIPLGRGNRRDFMNGLRAAADGHISKQDVERVLIETTEKGGFGGSDKNLAKGNLPGNYENDPS